LGSRSDLSKPDLEGALSRFGQSFLLLQAIIYPNNGQVPEARYGIVNVTGDGVQGQFKLPCTHPNGSAVYLGDPGMGYPPSLYPNLTYTQGPGNETQAFLGGDLLNYSSVFVIGPLTINESFSLFSLTTGINNNTSRSETLGWITVVVNAQMLYDVVDSPEGLDTSGEILLIGPNVKQNKFQTEIRGDSAQDDDNTLVKFVLPPQNNSTLGNRHTLRSWQSGNSSLPFRMGDYPAVVDAWASNNHAINNAGAMVSTHNEQNVKVSAGYATLANQLVDWAVVFEQSTGKVLQCLLLL
jgi:osomolarity two-component system sensor histidine kinase SLN1